MIIQIKLQMVIIHQVNYTTDVWNLSTTLIYINILQPVYFNVYLHGNFLHCQGLSKSFSISYLEESKRLRM